jgi:hypothetical protein
MGVKWKKILSFKIIAINNFFKLAFLMGIKTLFIKTFCDVA